MGITTITHLCTLLASTGLVSCGGYAVALNNFHPTSTHDALLIQPTTLGVDIPAGLGAIPEKNLSVEVRKAGTRLIGSSVSKRRITTRNSRWEVNLAPERWETGYYELKFFSSGDLVYRLETNFSYDLIKAWDY